MSTLLMEVTFVLIFLLELSRFVLELRAFKLCSTPNRFSVTISLTSDSCFLKVYTDATEVILLAEFWLTEVEI